MVLKNVKICIIGLGYVGLPLAVAFSERYPVVGFDINNSRIDELRKGIDSTLEIDNKVLCSVINRSSTTDVGLTLTQDIKSLSDCNVFIITVPTPIDRHKRPLLTPLIKASQTVASVLKEGDVVIFESTVYPGVTEDEMVPVLELNSGLKYNKDFFCGYSPERINPGDKDHTVTKILKVTSGSTPEVASFVDSLYRSVITAGTFKASSIKVAEAAKVIENSQRDINIAFVNELSKIFSLIEIDTQEVLEAAATKWNFLRFKPGLVGGHCIGVDPYYLAQKAQELGYHPEIILSGRRVNDSMGKHIATEVVKHMLKKGLKVNGARALILGITFKEDCPDVRNTRVVDIYNEMLTFFLKVDIYDPWASHELVREEYNIDLLSSSRLPNLNDYSAIILAVAHKEFVSIPIQTNLNRVVFDVKGLLNKSNVDARL